MKSLSILFIIFTLSSCITIETTSSGFKDEIYYSAETYTEVASQEQQQENLNQEQEEESKDKLIENTK